jgi:hypothetical protein
VASAQSKRQSRKRRKPQATAGAQSQPVPAEEITPERIQAEIERQRAARQAQKEERGQARLAARSARTQGPVSTTLTGKTYGDPPPNPFGGVPVSEIAILAGAVGFFVGLLSSSPPATIVGIVVCTLGVAEFSAREHFSGYRSHAVLLAAIPSVALGVVMIAVASSSLTRTVLLAIVVPVFVGLLVWLRKRFGRARQARIVRPSGS